MKRRDSRRRQRGQTAIEYLLTMMVLVTAFTGFYGFLQGQTKKLYRQAALNILRSYY